MMNRGTIATLLMVVVGLAMAGYAWWHQVQRGRRIHRLWGTEAVQLVRHAKTIEILWLAPAKSGNAEFSDDNGRWLISRRKDVTRMAGLVHAQHALISDVNYRWQHEFQSLPGQWSHAIRFQTGERKCTILFDEINGFVKLNRGARALLQEEIQAGLVEFIARTQE